MNPRAQDRKAIQNHAAELFRRLAKSESGDLDILLKEQFSDDAGAYERSNDLNLGLVVRFDGRTARAIVSNGAGQSALRFVFEDDTDRAIPCDSFQVTPPAKIELSDSGKPTGEFDATGVLECAFLCALLQATGVGQRA